MNSHTSMLKMYSKIYAQFDRIEFAESAARMIKENISGQKKIIIRENRGRFADSINSRAEHAAANGNERILYPFSTHSNNYMTNFVIKDIIKDEVNELIQNDTVTMEIVCEKDLKLKATQYLLSCGGYSITG